MWTDEASGAYIAYSSIAEEGTSSRAHFNAKYIYFSNSLSVSSINSKISSTKYAASTFLSEVARAS